MPTDGELVGGTLLLAFVLACAGGAGWLVVRRHAAVLSGLPLVLAWSLCATTALLVIHLAPLALGILSRGAVAATAAIVAGGALAWRAPPGAHPTAQHEPSDPGAGAVARACAAI